jgi:hypothetical protein
MTYRILTTSLHLIELRAEMVEWSGKPAKNAPRNGGHGNVEDPGVFPMVRWAAAAHEDSLKGRSTVGSAQGRKEKSELCSDWQAEAYPTTDGFPERIITAIRRPARFEDVETSGFGSIQEAPVLQSRQIREAGSRAVMAGKQEPKTLVDALVD